MKSVVAMVLAVMMVAPQAGAETWLDRQKKRPAHERVEMSQNLILLGSVLTIGAIVMSKQASDIKTKSRANIGYVNGSAAAESSWYNFGAASAGVLGLVSLGFGIRVRFL